MKNKRGQGLSTNAIILIILGVVVLVVLIIGFTVGWDKIAPWISSNNVDTIAQQCEVACSTGSVYDYCSMKRTLKVEGKEDITKTCYELATNTSYDSYGIDECPTLENKGECKTTSEGESQSEEDE
jgi:hypothetical protein